MMYLDIIVKWFLIESQKPVTKLSRIFFCKMLSLALKFCFLLNFAGLCCFLISRSDCSFQDVEPDLIKGKHMPREMVGTD